MNAARSRLMIASRRYSSWSMRGWLAVRLAGLDCDEVMLELSAAGAARSIPDATPAGLVPALHHGGVWIWESLAIAEYCAEHAPALWPSDRAARAVARSAAAEMHAGFRALRLALPMNLGRQDRPRASGVAADVRADIDRIAALWRELRDAHGSGGPFLFGATFGAADLMYAPVVTRFLSYGCPIDDHAAAYCEAVRAFPLVDEWYRAASLEDVRIEATEQLD